MIMKCDRCGCAMEPGEVREINGQQVCEDCGMDLLSPSRPCDPWAARAAKSVAEISGGEENLTGDQRAILEILGRGTLPLEELAQQAGLEPDRLERELATLHKMEKIGARLVDGVRRYQLWDWPPE